MGEIVIFSDITTDDVLNALEDDAKKYTGLYVDMEDNDGRRYVKQQASIIGDLLKRLDRARIDKSKAYKAAVEKEAERIRLRLEGANEPYTMLIDEYNAERKKILDAENARKQAIEDAAKLLVDHEFALLMNDKFDAEKIERERQRVEYEENLKREAAADAEARRLQQEESAKQAAIEAESKRIADVEAARLAEVKRQQDAIAAEEAAKAKAAADLEHVKAVNNQIKAVYLAAGFSDEMAILAVKLLVTGKIPNTKFNY